MIYCQSKILQTLPLSLFQDVKFTILYDPENTWVGASFEIGLRMKNNSRENRTVEGRITVSVQFYTGVSGDKLKSEPFTNILLKPGEGIV